MWKSRADLLREFQLSERTIARLEELNFTPLANARTETKRGRLSYDFNDSWIPFLRAASVFFTELDPDLPLLPFHRTFLAALTSEVTVDALTAFLINRGVVSATVNKGLIRQYHNQFIKKLPEECKPFFFGETDEENPTVTWILKLLGIDSIMKNQEILTGKHRFLFTPELRAFMDAMMAAEATDGFVIEHARLEFGLEIKGPFVQEYRQLFFDRELCGVAGIRKAVEISSDRQYKEAVLAGLDKGYTAVFSALNLKMLSPVILQQELLAKSRRLLEVNPTGQTGRQIQHEAINTLLKAVMNVSSAEPDPAADRSLEKALSMDLLRLKQNMKTNRQQLKMADMAKEDLDVAAATGTVKLSKAQ